jgi:PPOX class probable F420-dependent enzyme
MSSRQGPGAIARSGQPDRDLDGGSDAPNRNAIEAGQTEDLQLFSHIDRPGGRGIAPAARIAASRGQEPDMPKRRDDVAMTDDEIQSFIEGQKTVQVATINRDGTPHLVPLWFAIVDGDIVLETFTKSQKVKNLERDPRLTVLLEAGDVYEELRGVAIYATAELVKEFEEVHALHKAVLKRNTEIPEETLDKISRGMCAKKTAIVIKAHRTISWDHRKLGGIY